MNINNLSNFKIFDITPEHNIYTQSILINFLIDRIEYPDNDIDMIDIPYFKLTDKETNEVNYIYFTASTIDNITNLAINTVPLSNNKALSYLAIREYKLLSKDKTLLRISGLEQDNIDSKFKITQHSNLNQDIVNSEFPISENFSDFLELRFDIFESEMQLFSFINHFSDKHNSESLFDQMNENNNIDLICEYKEKSKESTLLIESPWFDQGVVIANIAITRNILTFQCLDMKTFKGYSNRMAVASALDLAKILKTFKDDKILVKISLPDGTISNFLKDTFKLRVMY